MCLRLLEWMEYKWIEWCEWLWIIDRFDKFNIKFIEEYVCEGIDNIFILVNKFNG